MGRGECHTKTALPLLFIEVLQTAVFPNEGVSKYMQLQVNCPYLPMLNFWFGNVRFQDYHFTFGKITLCLNEATGRACSSEF